MFDHRIRLQLIQDRQRQEIREAADNRLAARAIDHPRRRPVRSAVGRSLVRLGHALAAENDSAREPVRSR
jgi:hypothetical protein